MPKNIIHYIQTSDTAATITLQTYQPNFLSYNINNKNAGFAVFSEIYYPLGWQATVDGITLRSNKSITS